MHVSTHSYLFQIVNFNSDEWLLLLKNFKCLLNNNRCVLSVKLFLILVPLHTILNPRWGNIVYSCKLGAFVTLFNRYLVSVDHNFLFFIHNCCCKHLQLVFFFCVFKFLSCFFVLWLHFANCFEVGHWVFELAHCIVCLGSSVISLNIAFIVFNWFASVE